MKLPLAAMLVSAVALAAALAALRLARARPETPAVTQVPAAPEGPRPRTGGGAGSPPPVTAPPDDARWKALSERIDRLEEKLQELDRRAREPHNRAGDEPVDARALEAVVLDRVRTPAERAGALKKMRLRAPQARTIEIARSMIDLLRTCDDATVRAEICRQLFGLDYPEIGEEMMTRLRVDADEHTREEAAETLETFGDAPGVLQALEYAKEHDESPAVREQAAKTIAEIRAR